MTKEEQLDYLIDELRRKEPQFRNYPIPEECSGKFQLFRALCNMRMPGPVSQKFLDVQNALLRSLTEEKGITDASEIRTTDCDQRLSLWQGDITTLRCDAIVNAANSQMLGCFQPLHGCIDNIIHTMAGVQLRNECARQMEQLRAAYGSDYKQPTSVPMITPGYNLPAKYVIHVVGPIVMGFLTETNKKQLADCYRNSLELAEKNRCESIAFCCISTGVFMFPADKAAEIATGAVKAYLDEHPNGSVKRVIFNVFKDSDRILYEQQL